MRNVIWGLVYLAIMILAFGWYAFVIVAVMAAIIGLLLWKKPEWGEKIFGK